MKKTLKIASVLLALLTTTALPALAITEEEVLRQVDIIGRDAVTGNVFIWFLCAIGFLKVAQEIASYLSALGIQTGHSSGSMMTEAMIALRGFTAAAGFFGGKGGAHKSGSGSGFMQGGLAGIVSRSVTNAAVKSATGSQGGGLGGAIYRSSLNQGGGFANRVIGSIATGNRNKVGTITGSDATNALKSYMGYAANNQDAGAPHFVDVEIGGGRILATEQNPAYPRGIEISMYHADQFEKPNGDYTTVTAVDGTIWYKQYATDTVIRKPYTDEEGNIAYDTAIVKKLPNPPMRKDTMR